GRPVAWPALDPVLNHPGLASSSTDEDFLVIKHKLIHPQINEVLGRAGHHATILIADGNYPASSKKGPHAALICLNLMPGVVTCAQVFEAILSAVPIDRVNTMM